jgi:hypothetical protein
MNTVVVALSWGFFERGQHVLYIRLEQVDLRALRMAVEQSVRLAKAVQRCWMG